MTVPFPKQFADLLLQLKETWDIRQFHILEEFDGRSGSQVLLVDIESAVYDGTGVLKLNDHHGRQSNRDEKAIYDEVHQAASRFAEAHLPRAVASLCVGDKSAVLLTLAGQSLVDYQPLSEATAAESRRRLLPRIWHDMLYHWNCDCQRASELVSPTAMLQGWLGNRLGAASRLPDRLTAWGVFPTPWFSWGGRRLLPNPFQFATDPALWSRREIIAFIGRQHNDLHDDNILVPRRANSTDYFVIDLAMYEGTQFAFYDTAYLELSILLRDRAGAPPGRWLRFLDAIADSPYRHPHESDDEGLVALVRHLRSEEERWMRERQPLRRDSVMGQRLLARVAVGLNYANKLTATPEVQKAGLTFAAHSLDLYLNTFGPLAVAS
jgi:hypothetical protein